MEKREILCQFMALSLFFSYRFLLYLQPYITWRCARQRVTNVKNVKQYTM
jgi:hypothetical protein